MQYLRRSVSRNRKADDDEVDHVDVKDMDRKDLEASLLSMQKKHR